MKRLNYSSKKLGKTFKLQKEILKTEMNHDEINEHIWRDKKDVWVDFVQNDVLCTAFSYDRCCKAMVEILGFPMKDCLSLQGLGWKYFNSLKTEEDEPSYTYNDRYMRFFVRQSTKRGRVSSFDPHNKSKTFDDFLRIILEILNVKGNIY